MAKTWILDTDTKGTGAQVRPLEDAPEKAAERPRRRARAQPKQPAERRAARPKPPVTKSSTPLGPDQVRKKSTGEIGKLRSVDARAGTAVVHWLREGRTTTVPLTAISRR